MKIRIFGRIIFTAFLFVFYHYDVFPQINPEEKWKQPGLFLGCAGDLTNAQIINKETQSLSSIVSNKKISASGSIEIGYFISKYIGLTTGVDYNMFTSNLRIDSYQNQYSTVDRENESFELRVSGQNIGESQQVDILSIPVCINFRVPLNMKVGFYMQTGINFRIPTTNKFNSSGTFTYKGYFPAYNVLLENLPEYGFPTDLMINTDGELDLKPLIYGGIVSVGADYLIHKRVQFTLAAYYDRSFSDITDYYSVDEFNLISDSGQFNSIMSGSSKTALQSVALKLGIRYYISDYTKSKYYYRPTSKQYLRDNIRQKRKGFLR